MLFIIGRETYNSRPVYRVLNVDIHNGLLDLNNATVVITGVYEIFNMMQKKNVRGEYNLLQNAHVILRNATRRVKHILKYNDKNKLFYFECKDATTGEISHKPLSHFGSIRPDMLDLEGGVYGSLSGFRGYSSPDIVYTIIAEYFINGEHKGYCVVDQRCGGNIGVGVVAPAQIQIKQDVKFVSDTRMLYRKYVANQRMSEIYTNAEVKELQGGNIVVSPKKKYSETENFIHVNGAANNRPTQGAASANVNNENNHYDVPEWRIILLDGRTMRTGFKPGQDTAVFNKLKAMNVVELMIPQGVTDLSALNNMPYLRRLSIPRTINGGEIAPGVCYNCKSLEYVLLSEGITSISPDAFLYCPSLKAFSVNQRNTVIKSVDGVVFSADGSTLIRFPAKYETTTVSIPQGVTTIAEGAFRDCSIVRVNIPRGVNLIAAGAFFGCTSLVEAWVAATNIMEDSFCNCPNLVTFKLLMGVSAIRGSLISNNHCIDKLILPDTIERIIPFGYRARRIDSPLKEQNSASHFLIGNNTSIAHVCVPVNKPQLKYSANYFDGLGRVALHDNSVQTLTQAGVRDPQQYH